MNWYCVNAIGVAELCRNEEHAAKKTLDHGSRWPGLGPFRAVQLVDAQEVGALKARIAELERELEAVGAGGVQPMSGLPEGWVPCVVTYEGQQSEEVAYGPQRLMDRLKKWLDRYFAMRAEQAALTPGEPPRLVNECLRKDALTAIRALREWIDAAPKDTPLPAMPGVDGDWLDGVETALAERPPQSADKQTAACAFWVTAINRHYHGKQEGGAA
jgi:hypothetical protein